MKLTELPDELLVEVFKHLPVKQLASVARTCSQFGELCNNDQLLWQHLCERDLHLQQGSQSNYRALYEDMSSLAFSSNISDRYIQLGTSELEVLRAEDMGWVGVVMERPVIRMGQTVAIEFWIHEGKEHMSNVYQLGVVDKSRQTVIVRGKVVDWDYQSHLNIWCNTSGVINFHTRYYTIVEEARLSMDRICKGDGDRATMYVDFQPDRLSMGLLVNGNLAGYACQLRGEHKGLHVAAVANWEKVELVPCLANIAGGARVSMKRVVPDELVVQTIRSPTKQPDV